MPTQEELEAELMGGAPEQETPFAPEQVETPEQVAELSTPGNVDALEEQFLKEQELEKELVETPNVTRAEEGLEEESDYLGAVKTGLKEAILPHTLTSEEVKNYGTLGETLTRVGTNIVGSLGATWASAAAGGAIGSMIAPGPGTAVGAAVGLISSAAMRGFGYEAAYSDAHGQKFSMKRGVINTAVDVNPLIRWTKSGSKVVQGVTQAGLQGAQTYSYTEDYKLALGAGIFSGGLTGLTFKKEAAIPFFMNKGASPTSASKNLDYHPSDVKAMKHALSDDSGWGLERKWTEKVQQLETNSDYFDLPATFQQAQKAGGVHKYSEMFDHDFKTWFLNKVGHKKSKDIDAKFDMYGRKEGMDKMAHAWKTYKVEKVANDVMEDALMDAAGGPAAWKAHFIRSQGHDIPEPHVFDEVYNAAKKQVKPKEYAKMKQAFLDDNADLGLEPIGKYSAYRAADMKIAARRIDERTGFNVEGAIDALSLAGNRLNQMQQVYVFGEKGANELIKRGRKLGMSNREVYMAMDNPKAFRYRGENSDGKRELVEDWRRLFGRVYDDIRKKGMDIGYIENYVPHKMMRGQNLNVNLTQRYEHLEREAAKQGYDSMSALLKVWEKPPSSNLAATRKWEQHEAFRGKAEELMQALTLIGGKRPNPRSPESIKTAIAKTLDEETAAKRLEGFELSAAFERKYQIPEFVRERDIGKLFGEYMSGNLKAISHNDALHQISFYTKMLDRMGYKNTSKFLGDYIGHMSGREGMVAGWIKKNTVNRYRSLFDKLRMHEVTGMMKDDPKLAQGIAWHGMGAMEDRIKKNASLKLKAIDTARLAPDFMGFMTAQAYPNLLGLNIKAMSRNLTQPFILTAMDIKGGYGQKLAVGAYVDAAVMMSKGVKMDDFLQARGHSAGKFIGEGFQLGGDALRQIKGLGLAVEAADALGTFMMKAYGGTDTLNRFITWNMSMRLADDAWKGNPKALHGIKNMSVGYKNRAYDAMKRRDIEEFRHTVADYLIGATQFHYGKEQQSEVLRHMGRFFSMFTKWPVMMTSEMAHGVGKRDFRFAKKLVAPWAMLAAADNFLGDTKEQPEFRYHLGSSLKSWAPMHSVFSVATGDIMTPPVVDTGKSMVDGFMGAVDMDFEKSAKAADEMSRMYTPGFGAVYNEYLRYKRAHGR